MSVKNNRDTVEYYFDEGCYISELWNEKHDAAVSVARARLPAGQATLPHVLIDTRERYLILSGEGEVFVGDQSGMRVTADAIVDIAPGQRQCIINLGQQDLVFLAICSPRFRIENYRQVG